MRGEPHPLLDLDDAGQVRLGVAGDQLLLPLPTTTRAAPVEEAPPVVGPSPAEAVPGQLDLTGEPSVLGGAS